MDEQTREGVVQSLNAMLDNNPYYEFLGFVVEDVGPGEVTGRLPYTEQIKAPEVAPGGIHGGVLTTFVDSTGMASVIAQKQRPVPLVTEDISVTFHSNASEDLLAEGRVVSDGSTLVTSRIDVYPVSESGANDPTRVATGNTTARLLE